MPNDKREKEEYTDHQSDKASFSAVRSNEKGNESRDFLLQEIDGGGYDAPTVSRQPRIVF